MAKKAATKKAAAKPPKGKPEPKGEAIPVAAAGQKVVRLFDKNRNVSRLEVVSHAEGARFRLVVAGRSYEQIGTGPDGFKMFAAVS